MDKPAGKGTITSQFRLWPFPFTIIATFGERNRNPGHRFAGLYIQDGHIDLKVYSFIQTRKEKELV